MSNMLIGGRERREILLAEYDPEWAGCFEVHRGRIVAALGDRVLRIDRPLLAELVGGPPIGSTSVPGLAAKPIIDIDLSVADPDDESAYVADLEQVGYVLRVREPQHRMLRTPERDVHVHVCALDSDWEKRHLVFRDWLRTHPDDRQRYEDVKRALAGRVWEDMNEYADAKSDVIADIMSRAAVPSRTTVSDRAGSTRDPLQDPSGRSGSG